MAKPTGAAAPADYGHPVTVNEANAYYLYFAFPLPLEPHHWCDSTWVRRSPLKIHSQVTVAASNILSLEWHLSGGQGPYPIVALQEYTGAIASVWQTASTTDHCIGAAFDAYPTPPANMATPRYVAGYVKMWCDNAGANTLDAAYIECVNDNAYTSVDADARDVELIDRNTTANRTYKANRACSSFHGQRALAHSMNRLYNESLPRFCVPIFGAP